MDQICLSIPVLPAGIAVACDFLHQLDHERAADRGPSERRLNDLDLCFKAHTPRRSP